MTVTAHMVTAVDDSDLRAKAFRQLRAITAPEKPAPTIRICLVMMLTMDSAHLPPKITP